MNFNRYLLLFTIISTLFIGHLMAAGEYDSFFDMQLQIVPYFPSPSSRPCCGLGYDFTISLDIDVQKIKESKNTVDIPWLTVSQIIEDPTQIGTHKFGGNLLFWRPEKNGMIYTCLGGFIDLGHLRHWADATAYLAGFIEKKIGKSASHHLSTEGGEISVEFFAIDTTTDPVDKETILAIAQRIAYDLATWHEIITWYGVWSLDIYPETESSFAADDNFSNLLGTYLAAYALRQKEIPYETFVTNKLQEVLATLESKIGEETRAALDLVENRWWFKKSDVKNKKRRNFQAYPRAIPWLVPEHQQIGCYNNEKQILTVPAVDSRNRPLDSYYQLKIVPVSKIPFKKILGEERTKVTEQDFPQMIEAVKEDMKVVLQGPEIDQP